ncbi:FAD-dependent monooxygenase [Polycladidibacter hongkongensis]|uniref:FAD-dependent monooxygenase n=1 Tax=Polycladidibacter hongkongensis TaxID=1647556 RepID=UPI0008379926|nr:FAD-dependent monooxygenase [Pseudovibrio hongkongensis]
MSKGPLAISGAGIAGMTAALYLARMGYKVELFEAASQMQEVGAGLQLSANAVRCLEQIGLKHDLAETAIAPQSIIMRAARTGRTLAKVPLGKQAKQRFGAPYYVIHRADLQNLLKKAVEATPDITLYLGCKIINADQSDAGVTLKFAPDACLRGVDFAERTYQLLIAADGVWSALRTNTLALPPAQFSGRVAYRTTIDASNFSPRMLQNTGLWLGPQAHMVHYPLQQGRFLNIVAIAHEDWQQVDIAAPSWAEPATLDQLLPHFSGWSANATDLLRLSSSWTRWALCHIKPGSGWCKGRIALIGDAAHAMTPFMAQGAAMAIEDAAILAANVSRFGAAPPALASYASQRRPRAESVARQALKNESVYHMRAPASLARDTVLSFSSPAKLLEKFAWIFDWAPPPLADAHTAPQDLK